MPRYFFHVHDDDVTVDNEGLELPDRESAIAEAMRGARSLACEQVLHGVLDLRSRIIVADAAGTELATVTFGEAVTIAV